MYVHNAFVHWRINSLHILCCGFEWIRKFNQNLLLRMTQFALTTQLRIQPYYVRGSYIRDSIASWLQILQVKGCRSVTLSLIKSFRSKGIITDFLVPRTSQHSREAPPVQVWQVVNLYHLVFIFTVFPIITRNYCFEGERRTYWLYAKILNSFVLRFVLNSV